MNIFEFACILTPLAGLAAGIDAAAGRSVGAVVLGVVGGLVIGIGVYFVCILVPGWVWSRVSDPDAPPVSPGPLEWIAGTAVIVFALLSPIAAWFVSGLCITALLGSD